MRSSAASRYSATNYTFFIAINNITSKLSGILKSVNEEDACTETLETPVRLFFLLTGDISEYEYSSISRDRGMIDCASRGVIVSKAGVIGADVKSLVLLDSPRESFSRDMIAVSKQ